MKKLIIAEKPSVAADLARVLGKLKKNDDFYENDQYVISSAVGHLVELFKPDDIDKKYARWTLAALPIIPKKFELKPIEKTKQKLSSLKKLMSRKDIDEVVNACDAGREGELIFTYIYEITKCKLPTKRLWVSSMTPASILEAFEHLRTSEQMASLQDAARCRSESDWLVGMNGTRALTIKMGARGKDTTSVGRVQTPTLAMIVEREREIQKFKPQTFWKITAKFKVENGEYEGVFQKPKDKLTKAANDKPDRIWEHAFASEVLERVRACQTASATDKKTLSKQIAPRLYDLTSLQREANNKFSFPANKTLSIAQSLYEKHKLITYPRTDSRALPDDYRQVAVKTLSNMDGEYEAFAQRAIQYAPKAGKRIFDSKQVSDHFAIIPTGVRPNKLSDDERKIFDMVARRFMAAFYPEAQFAVTVRTTTADGFAFKSDGKVLTVAGWLDVYNKETDDKNSLPALATDPEQAQILQSGMSQEQTKPPARYNEATLLSAMEGAGKLLDDEELSAAMKEKGLGTPATRATIIENLIAHKFVERQRRDLIPTPKAERLITFLNVLSIDALTSPSMTGEWEYKLRLIEKNELTRDEFMKGIETLTGEIVDKAKNFKEDNLETTESDLKSPIDGSNLLETFRSYKSKDGKFIIYKTIGNRQMSSDEIRELLEKRSLGPIDGFRSKINKPYSARLYLDENNAVKFDFGRPADAAQVNLADAPVVADCPLCAMKLCKCTGAKLVDTGNAYVCRCDDAKDKKCNFRLSKTMLSHKITLEEINALATAGKTPVIEDFVSSRTKKKFSAALVLDAKRGISFEFAKKTGFRGKKDKAQDPSPKAE